MARLGPSGLAQLFREIANYVSTRLSNYNTKAELDSLLDAKADDNNVIHTSGDETIGGTKTFTSILKVSQGTLQVGSDTGYNVTYSWSGNIVSKQPSGTTFNISLPKANGTLAIDENIVHTSGNETISGYKSFTEVLDRRNDVTTSTVATATQLVDTNANRCGWIANRMHWAGNYHVHNRHIAYNENSGKEVYIDIISSNNGSGGLFVGGSATNRNLNDVTSATDYAVLATMGWVNNPATSTNVVHRSGDETIAGTKTFSDITVSNKELHYRDTTYDWTDTSINTWCDAGHVAWYDKTGNRRMHELVGAKNGVWRKACYINENQYFSVDSNRNISYWGTAIFNGYTIFNQDMIFKNNNIDLTVTPANTLYSNFIFTDKNDQNLSYIQYAKRNKEPDILGLYINDSNKGLHGIQITSNNYLLPMGNNIWNLGSPNNVWISAYINRITCNNIVRSVENSYIYMTAGPVWNSGASIFLNGKSGDGNGSGTGTFTLYARNDSGERYLLGRPDGTLTWTGCIESHEVRSTTGNAFMAQYGSYTFLIRNDGSNTYLLMSDKDGVPGTWSTARPLTISNATGTCNINGNANSATYSTTQAASDNSTKIATTAYVKSQGYVTLTSLAGGNSAGSLKHSVGSLILASCSGTAFASTKSYANVAGLQLYPCRTEIYTMYNATGYHFEPIVVRYSTEINLGSGTWRYLGGSGASINNSAGEIYGMFLRVA